VAAGAGADRQQRGAALDPRRLPQCRFLGATTATSAGGRCFWHGDGGAGKLPGRAHVLVARAARSARRHFHKMVHTSVGTRGVALVLAPRRLAHPFFKPSASSRPGPCFFVSLSGRGLGRVEQVRRRSALAAPCMHVARVAKTEGNTAMSAPSRCRAWGVNSTTFQRGVPLCAWAARSTCPTYLSLAKAGLLRDPPGAVQHPLVLPPAASAQVLSPPLDPPGLFKFLRRKNTVLIDCID